MIEVGGDCDSGDCDCFVVIMAVKVVVVVVVMMMMMMMMMMRVMKVVKANLVITVVVVEEELTGSFFKVKTATAGCSETWVNTCQNTQFQKPER